MTRQSYVLGFICVLFLTTLSIGGSLIAQPDDLIFKDGFENHAPEITSLPITTGQIDVLYSYDVDATDSDGDLLMYGLVVSPDGMVIDELSGEISWTPGELGIFAVEVLVSDGNRGSAVQAWQIEVTEIMDSDSDGLSDDEEVVWGTDPNNPDSDNDGLNDGEEVNVYATNPLLFDTDEDDYGDGTEILAGTDPLNPGDFPAGPKDPEASAPNPDPTTTTTVHDSTRFLYTGDDPIQTGVDEDAIDPLRAAVIRGRVLNRAGDPLPAVTITVLDHPEFGQTLSRANGMFDMVVNGGGYLTIDYSKTDFLPAQRQVEVAGQDWSQAPDVSLIQLETKVTTVDLEQTAEDFVLAQGSMVSDERGNRQATLLFPQGTAADLVMPDGSTQPIGTLNVRATEYTVGPNGENAMPAELPLGVGYTYCVELSVDEALSAGASSVSFSEPVINYVENFVNFPIGGEVPVYFYDRERGVWLPGQNGNPWFPEQPRTIVLKIVGVTAGLADLDTDGDDEADDADYLFDEFGITDTERQRISTLYSAGQSLWRIPVSHFSAVDYNWVPVYPSGLYPPSPNVAVQQPAEQSCEATGSIIECQNQSLGESVEITGTSFSLNYRSDRTPGRKSAYTLDIPLMGGTCPTTDCPLAINLNVTVAGQQHSWSFPPDKNQNHVFTWDGKDAYGRTVYGRQVVNVKLGFEYWARLCAGTGQCIIDPLMTNTLWAEWSGVMGAADARMTGLGGWTVNVNHRYDPTTRIISLGNGERIIADELDRIIDNIAGNGIAGFSGDDGPAGEAQLDYPRNMSVSDDGSVYFADQNNHRVRKVGPDGVITTIAGNGTAGFSGDGGLAVNAMLNRPQDVAFGSDGSVFIVDQNNFRIRKVSPDGIISTFAGNGLDYPSWSDYTEGVPATEGSLLTPVAIAIASDQTVYVTNSDYHTWKIDPAGIKWLFAGWCSGYGGDGFPAHDACFQYPFGVSVSQIGDVYIADYLNRRIRKIGLDGIVTTVAGDGTYCYDPEGICGDGGPALAAKINPTDVAVDKQGNIYFADPGVNRIRRVSPDGIISSIAGNGDFCFPPDPCGDGGLANAAEMVPRFFALRSNGGLLFSEQDSNRIRELKSPLPGLSVSNLVIASQSGSLLYVFDANGRHLRTINALTASDVYTFTYDSQGFLIGIEDAYNNITTIERDPDGTPTSIIGPYGQRTNLALDANGFLATISNPASEAWQFLYSEDGLLAVASDPNEQTSTYTYDEKGRLTGTADAAGGSQILARAESEDGYEVSRTTVLGRTTTYQITKTATADKIMTNTFPNGLQTQATFRDDGSQTTTLSDGSVIDLVSGPDPRFGMQSPVVESLVVTTPGGLTQVLEIDRTVTLSDPNDLLSLTHKTETVVVNGKATTTSFDAATGEITSTTHLGRQLTETINSRDRVVSRQTAGLASATYEYDLQGRLTGITHGSGDSARLWEIGYDADGYISTITDPLMRTTGLEYDEAGRRERQVMPDSQHILFGYDNNGNLTSVAPPGRPAHVFVHTPVDLMEEHVPPDGDPAGGAGPWDTNFSFNFDRQHHQITRPDGVIVSFDYDSTGRLEMLTSDRGVSSFAYDPSYGHVSSISTPEGNTLSLTYDTSLVTNSIWAGEVAGGVVQEYDNNFRITSRSVNASGATTFGYDDDGFLTTAGAMSLSRDPANGLLTGTTLGNVTDSFTYNEFGELEAYSADYSATPQYSASFIRDKLGRIVERTETVGAISHTYEYIYDLANRLEEVKIDTVSVSTYTYDDNDNRLSHNGGIGSYDDQDRLLQFGIVEYTYTSSGEQATRTNKIASETTTYDYDTFGNLIGVTLPDGSVVTYVVDGLNRRIGKKVDGTLVRGWLYKDNLNQVAELDGDGAVLSIFIYASKSNVPDFMVRNGNTYRIVSDHLGSPRMVIDTATGIIEQQLEYDEFGNILADSNPGFQPFGFAGGLYDPDTQLVRFGARDYDPLIGRWTVRDPILFAGGSTNLYSYAKVDPVNFTDPSGYILPAAIPGIIAVVGLGADFAISFAAGTGLISVGPGIGSSTPGSLLARAANVLWTEYAAYDALQNAEQMSDIYDNLIRQHQEREIRQLMDEIRELLYGCD